MKRTLCGLAMATLALGCSGHRSSSSGTASTATDQGTGSTGVPASDLSPEQVRLVQRALADRGYAVDLTGSFDARTKTALAEFQRARGLHADGRLDASTLETLGVDPRDVMPVRGTEEDADTKARGY